MRIIPRRIILNIIDKSGPWIMIYGRRKTGKTFLVKNFVQYDKYFFVNRDSTVLDTETLERYSYNDFLRIFKEILGSKRIVIDEFHRLPDDFMDFLHSLGINGNLILITSTLWFASSLLGSNSPLLGLFFPVRINLIDEREILINLSRELKDRELIEASTFLREPILIPLYNGDIRSLLVNFLKQNSMVLENLIGEIFKEEERELSRIYEGILKSVSEGKNVSTEISTQLYSQGLLSKDNPGVLQKYLDILVKIGLLDRVPVYNKKRYRYYHHSPLLDIHYYLEAKYSYTEIDTPVDYIRKVIKMRFPTYVESFIRKLLIKIFGLQHYRIEERNLEIDVSLLRFKKIQVVAEVKWRRNIPKNVIKEIEGKLDRFSCRRILIVPHKEDLEYTPRGIEIWDIQDIIEKAKESYEHELLEF